MNVKSWIREIHQNAVEHGWWETERDFGEICALIHSELSEALEEYRNNRPPIYYNCKLGGGICNREACADIHKDPWYVEEPCTDQKEKPEGIMTELADVVIRIFDYCGKAGLDMSSDCLNASGKMNCRSFGDFIADCHKDVSEAYNWECDRMIKTESLERCVIRIAAYFEKNGFSLEEVIRLKHEYNKTRPYRHGGKII